MTKSTDAKVTLIMRSTPFCGACRMVELQLQGEGIPYDTIDIAEQPSAVEEYGLSSVPVTLIDKADGERIRLDGFVPADVVKAHMGAEGRR